MYKNRQKIWFFINKKGTDYCWKIKKTRHVCRMNRTSINKEPFFEQSWTRERERERDFVDLALASETEAYFAYVYILTLV